MPADNNHPNAQEHCLLDYVQDISNRRIDPSSLGIETRIQLTELLRRDGWPIAQIAQLLKKDDRTIKRYCKVIRKRNRLNRHPQFTAEYAGEMLANAEYGINRLIRLATNKGSKGVEKIQAETSAWLIRERLTKLLQSMGFLDSLEQTKDHLDQKEISGPATINILPVSAKPQKESEDGKSG